MPPKRPPFLPGNYYHIYNRGTRKTIIFRDHQDYLFTQKRMKEYIDQFDLTLIAYCLMPNHYHFLVRQDGEDRAGLLPQRVFNSYSKAFNKRYGTSGTLFESSYKVKTVIESAHLLHLCCYIHTNPVKAGLVVGPADWPYSNYHEWIGDRNTCLFDPKFIKTNFGSQAEYRKHIHDFIYSGMHSEVHSTVNDYIVSGDALVTTVIALVKDRNVRQITLKNIKGQVLVYLPLSPVENRLLDLQRAAISAIADRVPRCRITLE